VVLNETAEDIFFSFFPFFFLPWRTRSEVRDKLVWWRCLRSQRPPIERVEVTEETKLVELCDEEYYHGLAKCFILPPNDMSMLVKHLKGKDEAGWEAYVKGKGGPDGLVSAWLMEKGLRPFLDGYVSPITKKAKSGDGSGSSASPGKWLS
jgi:hypothetical protein